MASVRRSRSIAWLSTLLFLLACTNLLAGCVRLLPSSKDDTISSWQHYDEVKAAFDKITPGNCRADLKDLGFDVIRSPNIEVLSYLDLASKVQSVPLTELDPGLQQCLRSRSECVTYVYDLRRLRGKRIGNFWADFFHFRRGTYGSGWRFNGLLVMVNDQLTYKLASGTPNIETYTEERNPLGIFQGSGSKALSLLPWK